jgi:hypothetical protein
VPRWIAPLARVKFDFAGYAACPYISLLRT